MERSRYFDLTRRVDKLASLVEEAQTTTAVPVAASTRSLEQLLGSRAGGPGSGLLDSRSELAVKQRKHNEMRSQLFLSAKEEAESRAGKAESKDLDGTTTARWSIRQKTSETVTAAGSLATKSAASKPLSRLQQERNTQEAMTDELLRLVSRLKANAAEVEHVVARDAGTMDESERLLSGNFARLARETRLLRVLAQKSGWTTLVMWIMLGLVLLMFVVALVFIRLFPKRY